MKKVRESRLGRVAEVLVEFRVFGSFDAAFHRLERDYPRGYPTDTWIDGVLKAAADGRLVQVALDKRGNYSWLARPEEAAP